MATHKSLRRRLRRRRGASIVFDIDIDSRAGSALADSVPTRVPSVPGDPLAEVPRAKLGSVPMLLLMIAASLLTLAVIDGMQDPHGAQGAAQVRYAGENALLRKCLGEPSIAPRVGVQTTAAPAHLSEVVLPAPTAGGGRAAEPDDPERRHLERCAHVMKQQRMSDAAWAMNTLLDPGTGLNGVLRLLRVVALAIVALGISEVLLRIVGALGVPLPTLGELIKSAAAAAKGGDGAEGPGVRTAGGLMGVVGTSLITGLTSLSVVGPELVQQGSTSARIPEVRISDLRQPERSRISESIGLEVILARLDALDRRFDVAGSDWEAVRAELRRAAGSLPKAEEWTVLHALAKSGLKATVTVDPSALKSVETGVEKVHAELRAVADKAGLRFDRLDSATEDAKGRAETGFRRTHQDAELARTMVRKRTCAMLAYFDHLESHRIFYSAEARDRLQRMRDELDAAGPTADCRPPAPDVTPPVRTEAPTASLPPVAFGSDSPQR